MTVNIVAAYIVHLTMDRKCTNQYTPLVALALVMFNDYIYPMTRY